MLTLFWASNVEQVRLRNSAGGGASDRAGIFKDDGIDFDEADQRRFWLDAIADLEARGDDYHLFTTGHFTDELFLDSLVRHHGVPRK
ncbi:hypothetical protein [Brevibacterium oceani]|uniref:hypothetical protein n=1 Tax=Brevibacterium oceani TaxID=358099 RepID=UPI0015E68E24|nr:hypothetical protein [Brevibacterium oceani]